MLYLQKIFSFQMQNMDSEQERTPSVQPEGSGSQMMFGDHVGIDEFCKVSDNKTVCSMYPFLFFVVYYL